MSCLSWVEMSCFGAGRDAGSFRSQCWELAMQPTELVTLTMRELDRLKVIQAGR